MGEEKTFNDEDYLMVPSTVSADKMTSCEIDCKLLTRADHRHHAACNGIGDITSPIIASSVVAATLKFSREDVDGESAKKESDGGGASLISKFIRYMPKNVRLSCRRMRISTSSSRGSQHALEMRVPLSVSPTFRDDAQIAICVCWNTSREEIAIAFRDNSVRIYDVVQRSWLRPRLQHTFQRGIRHLAWRPLVPNTLAVACLQGICIWTIIGHSSTGRSAWLRFLRDENGPILSLTWSPCGKWLASGSCGENIVRLWEPELSSAAPATGVYDALYMLQASSLLDSVRSLVFRDSKIVATLLTWSPNNQYLVAATSTGSVLIWETWTWRSETWDLGKSQACSSMSWNHDGSILLIAAQSFDEESDRFSSTRAPSSREDSGLRPIYMLRFASSPPRIGASLEVCDIDISDSDDVTITSSLRHDDGLIHRGKRVQYLWHGDFRRKWHLARVVRVHEKSCDLVHAQDGHLEEDVEFSDVRSRPTKIHQIALDPTGERLAISFTGSRSHRIALFATQTGSGHRSTFSRMKTDIIGPYGKGVYPASMQFRPRMDARSMHLSPDAHRGALLCVCWSNGCSSLYPMYFVPARGGGDF